MAQKRKASAPTTPPNAKRRTRSSGRVEVVIPLFADMVRREEAARSKSQTSAKPARPLEAESTSSDGSADDIDFLSSSPEKPEPVTPTKSRSTRTGKTKQPTVARTTSTKSSRRSQRAGSSRITPVNLSLRDTATTTASTPASRASSPSTASEKDVETPSVPDRKGKGRLSEVTEATSDDDDLVVGLLNSRSLAASDEEDTVPISPVKVSFNDPNALEPRFHGLLKAQRAVILKAIHRPPWAADAPREHALKELVALLRGSTERGQGNSCLIYGPRGSGKSRLVEEALSEVQSTKPVILRLSAEAQIDDKLAMREMARQLVEQTGSSYALPEDDMADDHNDALMSAETIPTTHLPALIATLTTLSRPAVVVLEAFELFAEHSRQALLYCLLDTVQSCHAHAVSDAASGSKRSGLAVVGVTSRVDCLNVLEKRVKSRFSGRTIRISSPRSFEEYCDRIRAVLDVPLEDSEEPAQLVTRWSEMWRSAVEKFTSDKRVERVLQNAFTFSDDLPVVLRMLTLPALQLSPNSPWLQPQILEQSYESQLNLKPFKFVRDLPYPCLALLIASHHVLNTGHDTFNFEMLWARFSRQVEKTAAMPVTVDGASVGMVKVPREVMTGSFERLIAQCVFKPIGPASSNVARHFVKYRCMVNRVDITEAVERTGNLRLKAWLKRSVE